MEKRDIQRIEATLEIALPDGYRDFLASRHATAWPDDTTIIGDADEIIEATLEYRAGFAGLPAWPDHWVYVGDEADACPYVLDCNSARVMRTDKGNLDRAPLSEYGDFASFLASVSAPHPAQDAKPESTLDLLRFYLPAGIALLVMFVVLPLVALGIRELHRMIF